MAILISQGMKQCGKCGKVKLYAEFHKRVASPDKLAFKCKPCVNEDSAAWHRANPNAYQEWYRENKDHKDKYNKNWDATNKELRSQLYAVWAKVNSEKIRALVVKRRAFKLQAIAPWGNRRAIEAIYREAARLTKETGKKHDVDHIVPLQGRVVRGLHWEGNLQILLKAQNLSKHNRHWPDMPC